MRLSSTLVLVFGLTLAAQAQEVVPPECRDGWSGWRPGFESRWCGRETKTRTLLLDSTPAARYCAFIPIGAEMYSVCAFQDLDSCTKSYPSAQCRPILAR